MSHASELVMKSEFFDTILSGSDDIDFVFGRFHLEEDLFIGLKSRFASPIPRRLITYRAVIGLMCLEIDVVKTSLRSGQALSDNQVKINSLTDWYMQARGGLYCH